MNKAPQVERCLDYIGYHCNPVDVGAGHSRAHQTETPFQAITRLILTVNQYCDHIFNYSNYMLLAC
jgi:hypothetical protein